jgi:hypothetical protein
MWDRFVKDGATAGLAVLPGAVPPFDHCQFSALASYPRSRAAAFQEALLAMDGSGHPEDAATLALEGVRERWLPPRGGDLAAKSHDPCRGYEGMLAALELFGEPAVRWPGQLHTPARHPFKHLIVDSALVRDAYGC